MQPWTNPFSPLDLVSSFVKNKKGDQLVWFLISTWYLKFSEFYEVYWEIVHL